MSMVLAITSYIVSSFTYCGREIYQNGIFLNIFLYGFLYRHNYIGEVLRVMDRGTQSINNLLSYVLFNIAPTLVDIGVAVVYFIIAFDGWFGLIVFTTMVSYILFTIYITEWRTKFRR